MMKSIAFASLLLSSVAHGDDLTTRVEQPYHHAVSLQVLTLDTTGMSLQGERHLGWKKLSVAVSLGARAAAYGDYGSTTLGAGVELRRWLLRPTTMKGWYVAARTDLARTSIDDMVDDRDVGSMLTWSAGISTGYRFVIKDRVEITPSIGSALVVESGTMSPATARGAAIVSLTAGVVF